MTFATYPRVTLANNIIVFDKNLLLIITMNSFISRDVNETFSFETETFDSLFEMRPRRDVQFWLRDETETF